MAYVIRKGLLVPKREVMRRKSAHVRVARANIILRRIADPILRPARSATAFDAASTAAVTATSLAGTTGLTDTGLTVGASANCVMYCVSITTANAVSGITAVWDSGGTNQAMTTIVSLLNTTAGNLYAYIFGLVGPVTGNKTFKVSGWTSTVTDISIFGVSFTGVNQAGGATTWNNTNASQNITAGGNRVLLCNTTSNDLVLATTAWSTGLGASFSAGPTILFSNSKVGGAMSAAGAYENAASQASFTCTASGTSFCSLVATNIAGAAGGGAAGGMGPQGMTSCEW